MTIERMKAAETANKKIHGALWKMESKNLPIKTAMIIGTATQLLSRANNTKPGCHQGIFGLFLSSISMGFLVCHVFHYLAKLLLRQEKSSFY
jgi:L-asparagine transporter-like permease